MCGARKKRAPNLATAQRKLRGGGKGYFFGCVSRAPREKRTHLREGSTCSFQMVGRNQGSVWSPFQPGARVSEASPACPHTVACHLVVQTVEGKKRAKTEARKSTEEKQESPTMARVKSPTSLATALRREKKPYVPPRAFKNGKGQRAEGIYI